MDLRISKTMGQVYSLQRLFQLIDQPKHPHEFYSESYRESGIDYYISRITQFTSTESRIICGFGDEIPLCGLNIEEQTILTEDSEVLLFLSISHNEDFIIERQKSMDDVLEFMYGANGIQNEFWGDIGVIYRNQRKQCYVQTQAGNFVTKEDITAKEFADLRSAYKIEFR